eukprot:698303-Alexandrium_andersonii.AAC.1
MSASLVGSEMCIRDRGEEPARQHWAAGPRRRRRGGPASQGRVAVRRTGCLLYTSDAADDM